LKELDLSVYQSLVALRDYELNDIESAFSLTFSIPWEVWGEVRYLDLKENGADILVTIDNRQAYIDLYVNWYLNKSIEKQFRLFEAGFKKVVDGDVIKVSIGNK
jgi:hypothetical protein